MRAWIAAGTIVGVLVATGTTARGNVKPHALISKNMVLQQGATVPVWGTADDGEEVTVQFQGQNVHTTAANGGWLVSLAPLKPGGPFTMTITGKNTLTIDNVLVGEIWVCSGQSNMEMGLGACDHAAEDSAAANYPKIRLLTVPHKIAETPQRDVHARWVECSPKTVGGFSGVAYYFGRDLHQRLGVPIGLIHTSFGGTPAEAWTSRAALLAQPMLRSFVEKDEKLLKATAGVSPEDYNRQLKEWQEAARAAKKAGKPLPRFPTPPPSNNPHRPSVLYNGMLAPIIPYAIRGAIWYQGESNAGEALTYQTLFPTMIRNWRADWKQGDFPFLFVQLAPFMQIVKQPTESNWAELREAQRLTAHREPNTAMAVITDVGDERDIHPKRKGPVGARLALAARALAYGESITYSGPEFSEMTTEGDKAVINFHNVGSGLVAKDGPLTGFTLAGPDHRFVNATAEIRGDQVVVSSPSVKQPAAVRFGWANYPVVNLWNKEGLPATPFRTDNWPRTAQER